MYYSRLLITAAIVTISSYTLYAQQPGTTDGSKECVKHSSPATASTPAAVATTAAPTRQILFFMNPNGRPCQMQLSILDAMKPKLSDLAIVRYIKTTESADREKFGAYGIRGLPSLIITDQTGKELKRLLPGIQDEAAILSALTDSAE